MAPRNAAAMLSFTVDSASEDEVSLDELNALPTPESNNENKAPARKPRGKNAEAVKSTPKSKALAKGRPAARRVGETSSTIATKGGAAVAKKSIVPKGGRKALSERKTTNDSDTEEVDEFADEDVVESTKTKRGRPPKTKVVEDDETAEVPVPAKRGRRPAAKGTTTKKETESKAASRTTKRKQGLERNRDDVIIPETQPTVGVDLMDIEDSVEVLEIPESMPPPAIPSSVRRAQAQSTRANQTRRRAGSASDSERDPALRRKVGDLTRKLEAMTVKYDTLKEAASSGKETNFDQLKRRTEQTAEDQDAVIKALKQQIDEMQCRTFDISSLKRELTALSKDNARLTSESKQLTDSLSSAQHENKLLSSKLIAARASAQQDPKAVPGSAIKPRTNGVVLPGSVEAAKEAQLAKDKVDMYSDFTNLVILGMKKNEDDESVYDCLQTGRNGTLHFHLTVASSGDSYEDTEFVYQPLLRKERDDELLHLLPDFLREEIAFQRGQAAEFYRKVTECMSKRIILEED